MTESEIKDGRYIGNNIYASADRYQVWLAVGQQKVVALDPATLAALLEYVHDIAQHYNETARFDAVINRFSKTELYR